MEQNLTSEQTQKANFDFVPVCVCLLAAAAAAAAAVVVYVHASIQVMTVYLQQLSALLHQNYICKLFTVFCGKQAQSLRWTGGIP